MENKIRSGTFFVGLFVVNLFLYFHGYLIIALALSVSIAVFSVLSHIGDSLLFFPDCPSTSRSHVQSPDVFDLPHQEVYITSQDGVKLHLIFIKQCDIIFSMTATVIFFHGNSGNIGHRLANANSLYRSLGCNLLLVEYRGYGKSEGRPGEEGFYKDAEAALNYILERKDVNKKEIMVFGRSLGGAMVMHLTSHPFYSRFIKFGVIENSFTNVPEMAIDICHFKLIKWLANFIFKHKFDNKKMTRKIKTPILFLSGLQDAVIPSAMMAKLYEDCQAKVKRLVTFELGGHNNTWDSRGYCDVWKEFIKESHIKCDDNHITINLDV